MADLPSVSGTTRPRSLGYDGYLDDLLLRFNLDGRNQVRIRSAQNRSELPNTADEPEEFGGLRPAVTVADVTGGSGLFFGQRPSEDPRDPSRFWSSRGINNEPDKAGTQQGFRLLRDTENAVSDTTTNPHAVNLDDTVLFGDGSSVSVTTTVLGTPSTGTEDPHTGTQAVTGLAVLGSEVFAAVGTDGIGKRSNVGTWSDLASAPAEVAGIWSAKRRLIADTVGAIAEINETTGADTALVTLADGVSVTDVTDGGAAILVACDDGVVYSLVDNAGTLELAAEAKMADYEYPSAIHAVLGLVFIGTTVTGPSSDTGRFYVGQLGSQTQAFAVTDLELVRELDAPVTAFGQRKDSVYGAIDTGSESQLWRYHLATGSLTEDLRFTSSGQVFDVLEVKDRLVVARSGLGLDREMDSYVTEGYLISSAFDFFTDRDKAWLEIVTDGALPSGTTIDVSVTTDLEALNDSTSASWQRVQRIQTSTALGFRAGIYGTKSRYMAVMLTLRSEAGTSLLTPIVSASTLIAEPSTSEIIVQVPVNVSNRIERPHRKPIYVKDWGKQILQELLSRAGEPATLHLYDEELTVRGSVVDVDDTQFGQGVRAGGPVTALLTVRGEIEALGSASAFFSGTTLGVISMDGTVSLGA